MTSATDQRGGSPSGRVYDLSGVRGKPTLKSPEGVLRHGLKKCRECRKQFTVKVGTVFEHARMPLHKMLQAVHLIASSKKGISAHQLGRILEVQYKAAWFLAHRIREAMRSGEFCYNTRTANGIDDRGRAVAAVRGIVGKRLTYARPDVEA